MSPDGERWLEVASELTDRIGGAVRDVIPPEAQRHLLNAQRELLTALFLIYEHQAGARRPATPPASRPRARRKAAPSATRPRVKKIEIE